MKRKYELKKRAESQRRTRQRIVEAAIELHAIKGPAQTTLSEVARRAGVQRHTLYRHFPDSPSLALACSGLYAQRNPMPDVKPWLALQGEQRLRRGLSDLYEFYEQNQQMLSRVIADAESDEPTRRLMQLRFGEQISHAQQALAQALPARKAARAALALALDFHTWQRLRRSGLARKACVDTMVRALLAQ